MSAYDIGIAVIIVFLLGVGMLATNYIIHEASDTLINSTMINTSSSAVTALQNTKTYSNRMDYVIFWIFISFLLGLIILSFYMPVEKVFLIFYIIIIAVLILVSAIASYVWNELTTAGTLSTMLVYFPITNHILSNAPVYLVVISFICMVITFGKTSSGKW